MRLLLVIFGLFLACNATKERVDEWADSYNNAWSTLQHLAKTNATIGRLLAEHLQQFNTDPDTQDIAYSCDLPASPTKPTSAHEVRPGDINVIGSIGDSITAGYGITASSVIEVILNDRQESWVPGGQGSIDSGVITVANLLRTFNPSLEGFSYAESWEDEREAGLNVAVGGAIAEDLYAQAEMLVSKMNDPSYNVNWNEDWKLISLLIGGNDLCQACLDPEFYSPQNFANYIQRALDYLYSFGPPRMIIIISNIFDITPLPAFSDNLICDIIQGTVCGCASETTETRERQRQYVAAVYEMLQGRYDNPERPDFTVIPMTHFDEALPPVVPGTGDVDRSYWSPDCFHPGRKGHYAVATSQWNQLFEPVGQKRTTLDWQIGTNLFCPSEEDPFIKTNVNSLERSGSKEVEVLAPAEDEQSGSVINVTAAVVGSVGAAVVLMLVAVVLVLKNPKVAAFFSRKTKQDENPIVTEMECQANPVA